MLSHVSLGCTNLEASTRFYTAVLEALGHTCVWTNARGSGFGPRGKDDVLAIKLQASVTPPGPGFHLAFKAETRAEVDAFYIAAMKSGGRDNGAPGLRPQYGENYYAAFVFDLDGHNIEAVCHSEQSTSPAP